MLICVLLFVSKYIVHNCWQVEAFLLHGVSASRSISDDCLPSCGDWKFNYFRKSSTRPLHQYSWQELQVKHRCLSSQYIIYWHHFLFSLKHGLLIPEPLSYPYKYLTYMRVIHSLAKSECSISLEHNSICC